MQYPQPQPPLWQQPPPMENTEPFQQQWQPSPSSPLLPDEQSISRSRTRSWYVKLILIGLMVLTILGLGALGVFAYTTFFVAPTSQVQVTPSQSTPTLIPTSTLVSTPTPTAVSVSQKGPQATVTPAKAVTPTPIATPGKYPYRGKGHHGHRFHKP